MSYYVFFDFESPPGALNAKMERLNITSQTFTITGDPYGNIVIPLDPYNNGDVISAEFIGTKPTSINLLQNGYDYVNKYYVIGLVSPVSTIWTIRLTWIKGTLTFVNE